MRCYTGMTHNLSWRESESGVQFTQSPCRSPTAEIRKLLKDVNIFGSDPLDIDILAPCKVIIK